MSSKSIFQQTHAPRTSRLVPMFDGATTSVHSNLAIGRVCGDHREIMAVVSPTATDDDVWRVVNLKSKGSDTDQFDSIAVLGAIDDDQAVEWAFNQRGRFLLDSIVLSVGETNTPGLKRYLDSERLNYRANSQIHLNQLSKLQDMTTGQPVMWDGVNLKSHSNSSAVLLVDLVKHDDNSQLFDAIKADDMPALLELLGAEAMGYDALIVENRHLDKLMQRLSTAMSKATQSGVTVTNVRQSEPFKRNKVTQVAAIFEMSDGQSVSIVFHNPDSTPSKLLPQDTLISWKFLLNSRDISAAVQPNQGEDVQLPVLATRVMKLVNQNSARFARTNAKKAENVAALDEAKARIETKSQTVAALDAEIAQLQAELDKPVAVAPTTPKTTGSELTDAQKVVLIVTAGYKPAFRLETAQRHTRASVSSAGGITEDQYKQAVQELNENGRYLKRSAITDAGRKIVDEIEGDFSTDKLKAFIPVFAGTAAPEPEPAPTPAVEPEIKPAYLPKSDGSDAGDYIQAWGEFQFMDEQAAHEYALRLEAGEGGKWRAEQIGGKWRARRVTSYDQPTYRQWDDALESVWRTVKAKGVQSLIDFYGAMTVESLMQTYESPMSFLKDAGDKIKLVNQPAVEPEPTPEVKPDPTAAMRAGKMQAHLNQSIQTTDGKVTTIGKLIDLRISQGGRPVEKSKRDPAAEKRLMTEFEALARNAPIGNRNHPDTIRLNELKAMKKDPSKFKYGEFVVTVPSYFLEGKDGEPSMVLTKTGFEYAQSVVANMPDPAPTPEEPTVTATNPDAEFFQSIISGTIDPLTVDMDYVIELAEKHENDPEMGALLEDALEAINKAEQAASQGI